MSGIVGIINNDQTKHSNKIYKILDKNKIRGNETHGFLLKNKRTQKMYVGKQAKKEFNINEFFINNMVKNNLLAFHFGSKSYQEIIQPVCIKNRFYIIHNGTISNAKRLAKKYNFNKSTTDSEVIGYLYQLKFIAFNGHIENSIVSLCRELEGGFAFIIYDDILNKMIVVKNYKSLMINYKQNDHYIVCSEEPKDMYYDFREFPTNTAHIVNFNNTTIEKEFKISSQHGTQYIPKADNKTCVVSCSGGLDSSTSAYIAKKMLGYENIIILNMSLKQRGWESEKQSAKLVADSLDAKFVYMNISSIFSKIADTPLTNFDLDLAQAEYSSQSVSEWVPMRNTIMFSIASGIAESYGASTVISGANMEEEGVYPDNDLAFLNSFNLTLNHGSLREIKVLPVVSRLMKKDIVLLGTALGVPFDITTSCYNPISLDEVKNKKRYGMAKNRKMSHIPCGTCGCCLLRRQAFKEANIRDPQASLYNKQNIDTILDFSKIFKQKSVIKITEEWKKEIIERYRNHVYFSRN
jgi:7-cyano-7-deazaguanine synthase